MSNRSSLAARNSNASKGFAPSAERAKDLSRGALLLGTALGCSIAILGVSAPGAAHAATGVCTPVIAGGLATTTCTAGTYPTGINISDVANDLTVTVNGTVVVTD